MGGYILKLLSADDAAADSIVWSVAVSVLGMLALAFYQAVANHAQIGMTELGAGLAAVITAGGAVRVGREHFTKEK
jgi:hypothetical protein